MWLLSRLTMRGLFILSLLMFSASDALTVASSPKQDQPDDPISDDAVEAFINDFFAAQLPSGAGVAVVVVRNDELVFSDGSGVTGPGGDPVDPAKTVFRAASISKLITATAVMQQVEAGQLDLDEDVNTYFSQFQLEGRYPEPVTLAHLLTHTGGIDDGFLGNQAYESDLMSMGVFFAWRTPRQVRPPGDLVAYSNRGMALAAHTVETVTGLSFDEYVQSHIFEPLQMRSSTFAQPIPEALQSDAAYDDIDTYIQIYPSGSLVTTAEDMAHFMIANLNSGEYAGQRILEPDTVANMHAQHFTQHPGMPGMAYGFMEGNWNNKRVLFHTGLRFHSSLLFLIPEEKIGVFLIGHGLPEGSEIKREFADQFMDQFYPAEDPITRGDDLGNLGRFAGTYRASFISQATVEKLMAVGGELKISVADTGTLILDPPGAPPEELIPVEPRLFHTADGLYVAFRENERGRITHLFVSGSTLDPISARRLAWYELGIPNLLLAAVGGLIFGVYLLFTLVMILKRRLQKQANTAPAMARLAWSLATLVCVLILSAPILLIGWVISGGDEPLVGIPSILYIAMTLALLASLISLSLPVFTWLAWKHRYWGGSRRILYTLVTIPALVMLPWLHYWNLLGYRF